MADPEILKTIVARFSRDQKVTVSKWFGSPCVKTHNKVFAILWGRDVAFKLAGEDNAEALRIPGARLFDPRGKGHPMKEWVKIPADEADLWERFAELAFDYVSSLTDKESRM